MASTCWVWPSWPVQGLVSLVAVSGRSRRVPGDRVTGFHGMGRLTSCCVMWCPWELRHGEVLGLAGAALALLDLGTAQMCAGEACGACRHGG